MKQNRADILRERYAKIQQNSQNIQTGTLYIFENHKSNDFDLPKKSLCGKKLIGPKGTFKGDEYFITFVKTGDLRIKEVLAAPVALPKQDPVPVKPLNETTEVKMEKLILDQPDKFTVKGQTEQVVVNQPKMQNLSEITGESTVQEDVLLNENPMAGIQIIKD